MAGTTITSYRNGPYLVRGDFTVLDQDGNEIQVRRRTIALCRCGRSRMRPFCDGTHQLTNFRAESGPEPAPWSLEPEAATEEWPPER